MNPVFSPTFFSVLLVLRLESQPLLDHCPFNSGLCNWRNVDDVDTFNWTLHSGCTPSNYTGPNCHRGNKNKLTLKLLERLDRCYAEVHYGTVYGFFYWLSLDYVENGPLALFIQPKTP